VHHRYQRHRWQILPPVPLVLLISVAKLPPVSTIPAVHLELRISPRIFEKIGTALIVSGAWGKLMHVENLKSKISWHCSFYMFFCRKSMSLIHGLNQTVRYGEEMEWRGDSREYSSVGSFMGQLYTPTTHCKKS
jgi:hypothetical protein